VPENTPYFEAISSNRAMGLNVEDALQGGTLLSIETCDEFTSEQTIYTFVLDHFDKFLRFIRLLPKLEQDLILAYYTLGVTQTDLGRLFGLTQTVCSSQLRLAVRCLGALIMFQGCPTEAQLEPILSGAGCSTVLMQRPKKLGRVPVPLAKAISLYVKTRSFGKVADQFGLHRPEIRRSFRHVATGLQESQIPVHQGVGAWIQLLIDRMSATGSGYTQRATAKMQNTYRHDSELLGSFRVSITEPDFEQWFRAKAAR
jgi:hypothetical protein